MNLHEYSSISSYGTIVLYLKENSATAEKYKKANLLETRNGRPSLWVHIFDIDVPNKLRISFSEDEILNEIPFILTKNKKKFIELQDTEECLQFVETIPVDDIEDNIEVIVSNMPHLTSHISKYVLSNRKPSEPKLKV